MGKLERKIVKVLKPQEEYPVLSPEALLQVENEELKAKVEKLTKALDSDVRVIKQAAGRIQELQEANAKMARILKARGIMTLDGRFTSIQ